MRLATAQPLLMRRQRLFVALTRLGRAELDAVGQSFLRWPDLWGRPVMSLVQELLRGRSNWTVGERELFAAVVSEANSCSFCVATHARIAERALAAPAFGAWRDGAVRPEATAAAHFLVKLTKTPDRVGPEDVGQARAAGVSDGALAEAIYIAFLFNLVNRVADALGFSYRSERDRVRGSEVLRRLGYRLPGFLFAGSTRRQSKMPK